MDSTAYEAQALRLHVELDGSLPVVWRTLYVPASSSVWDVNAFIAVAFGWSGSAQASLEVEGTSYDDPGLFASHAGESDHVDARTVDAGAVMGRVGAKAAYTYDGTWEVAVRTEAVVPNDDSFPYPLLPVCTAGHCANPPEQAGDLEGFESFLDRVDETPAAQRGPILAEMGLDPYAHFDPMDFDPKPANVAFAGQALASMGDAAFPAGIEELKRRYLDLLADKISNDVETAIGQEDTRKANADYQDVMNGLRNGEDFGVANDLFALDEAERALGMDMGSDEDGRGASLDEMMKRMGDMGLLAGMDEADGFDLDALFGPLGDEDNKKNDDKGGAR